MLKISKLTDYGLLAAVYLARHNGEVASAREIAKPESKQDHKKLEKMAQACFDSDDYREGVRAFMEKRAPSGWLKPGPLSDTETAMTSPWRLLETTISGALCPRVASQALRIRFSMTC